MKGDPCRASFTPSRSTRQRTCARFLAEPDRHWRKGYSACELATSWVRANDIPRPVRRVLDTCPPYLGADLIEGFFEREVDLRTPGRPSQTDLLALVRLRDGGAAIAVEGKVAEPFGPLVAEWLDGDGKRRRLAGLCSALRMTPDTCHELRYQLFHRTASALFEAERYGFRHALMLVHSFSPVHASLQDYQRFAAALGMTGANPDAVSSARTLNGIELRLAWVADRAAP